MTERTSTVHTTCETWRLAEQQRKIVRSRYVTIRVACFFEGDSMLPVLVLSDSVYVLNQ